MPFWLAEFSFFARRILQGVIITCVCNPCTEEHDERDENDEHNELDEHDQRDGQDKEDEHMVSSTMTTYENI